MEKEKKKSGGKPKDVFAFLGKHSKLAESPFFFFFLPFLSKDLLHELLREGSKGGGGGAWAGLCRQDACEDSFLRAAPGIPSNW